MRDLSTHLYEERYDDFVALHRTYTRFHDVHCLMEEGDSVKAKGSVPLSLSVEPATTRVDVVAATDAPVPLTLL